MKKNLIFSCLLLLFLSVLAGCTGKDGRIYGQKKVIEYVDSICQEPYELVEKKWVERHPDNMEYSFRTVNRDLSFQANSYLSPIWIDATQTSFYSRELSCSYVSAVREQYSEELQEVLTASDLYLEEHGWMYLLSFSDIDRVIETILEADKVYQQELEYNSKEFLQEHPLFSVHLVWHRSEAEAEAHDSWVNITDIGITGQNQKEELYLRLANAYAQLSVNGKITDSSDIPSEYLEGKHVSMLPDIELDGREMLYDISENPYGPCGLTTDDYKYCWYNQELDSYMMVIDAGYISDGMSFPLIIREYVRALGGTYDVRRQDSACSSTWTIGSDTWKMAAEFSDGDITGLEIEKNGEKLSIPYLTVDEDINIRASFCAGVTADDFCRLLPLSYEIDEKNGRIIFSSIE